MAHNRRCWCVLLAAIGSVGAEYRTAHFVVEAPDQKVAQKVGETAERWRKALARQWLGKEMPDWQQLLPVRVTVPWASNGGATDFSFDTRGAILSVDMRLAGSLDYVLNNIVPHEITHVVFAYYFRTPVPRWADEGTAIMSESLATRARQERLMRVLLAREDRFIPLRRLFSMNEYPRDVLVLYTEGYSVSRFLIESRDRETFLVFVTAGMANGWDKACRRYYRFNNIEEMEKAWLAWVRAGQRRRKHHPVNVRLRILQAEVKLFKLENQPRKNQREPDRLEKEVRRARRALERLRRETRPSMKSISPLRPSHHRSWIRISTMTSRSAHP